MKKINSQALSQVSGGLDMNCAFDGEMFTSSFVVGKSDNFSVNLNGVSYSQNGLNTYINSQHYSTLVPGVWDFSDEDLGMKCIQTVKDDGTVQVDFSMSEMFCVSC